MAKAEVGITIELYSDGSFDEISKFVDTDEAVTQNKKRGMKYLICAILKNEHNYLAEWIEHHLSLGFDEIYLFEDFGSKSHSEITDKYPQVHLITCDEYLPIKRDYDIGWARQTRLYQKFLNEHRNEGWCAFIDIDEYIMFNDGYTLQQLTQEYSDAYGIALYWKQFNANGKLLRADKLVETYTQPCECIRQDRGYAFKSFVNLNVAREFLSTHLIENLTDVTGKYVTHDETTKANYSKVQLNHYFCKSYEDWCDRFVRGDLSPNHRKFEQFFENNPDMRPLWYKKHFINRKRFNTFKADDLISVCMCTYNREKYLDNVIANILNQTYENLEFVIVDDGSTDNSREILEKWANIDPRVRVIYSDHDFIKSRNLAFKSAKGSYIACMDSDDECALDRIEKQFKYLQEHPDVDVVGTQAYKNGKITSFAEKHDDIINAWAPNNNEMMLFGSLMIRRSLLDKFTHDYFFEIFKNGGEDTIFKLCALNYGAKFANIQEPLYQYIIGEQSITHNWRGYTFETVIHSISSLSEALLAVKKLQEVTTRQEREEVIVAYKQRVICNLVNSICEWNTTEHICVIPLNDRLCAYSIGKCGCSTLSAISAEYYKTNPIPQFPTHPFQGEHNYIDNPDQIDREVVLVYRDPINRWKSFYQNKVVNNNGSHITTVLKKTLKETLTLEDVLYATEYSLKNIALDYVDSHIRPIADQVKKLKRVDYFVDIKDLDRFLTEQGIEHSIENSSGDYNVELTEEQETLLKELYAEDYKLLDKYELWKPSSK